MIAVDTNVLVGAIKTFDPQLRAAGTHPIAMGTMPVIMAIRQNPCGLVAN